MLNELVKEKEIERARQIKKKYTNILSYNVNHNAMMRVVYSKESLQMLEAK
jgi:NifU-like protein involved in Fe-S cluster formation